MKDELGRKNNERVCSIDSKKIYLIKRQQQQR